MKLISLLIFFLLVPAVHGQIDVKVTERDSGRIYVDIHFFGYGDIYCGIYAVKNGVITENSEGESFFLDKYREEIASFSVKPGFYIVQIRKSMYGEILTESKIFELK